MNIPETLDQWNLEVLKVLLANGIFETDVFDFKQTLPVGADKEGKSRLRKTVCAFANSMGGFLVFGISDDRNAPVDARMVGIDPQFELPRNFGSYLSALEPSVYWEFKNPAIELPGGKLIHICRVPKSMKMPHCSGKAGEGLIYSKRTNQGNESMSEGEVRLAYLNFYEKRIKLQLLYVEVGAVATEASGMLLPREAWENTFNVHGLGLEVIESVLADTFSVFAEDLELIEALRKLRTEIRIFNSRVTFFRGEVSLPVTNRGNVALKHNEYVSSAVPRITTLAGIVMDKLNRFLRV